MVKSTVLQYFLSGTTSFPENEETKPPKKVSSLEEYSSPAISLLRTLEEETWQFSYCRGSYLGTLKCFIDTLPSDVLDVLRFNKENSSFELKGKSNFTSENESEQADEITPQEFIKFKVDENVLNILEKEHPDDILPEYFLGGFLKYANRRAVDDQNTYETLLKLVCGFKSGGEFRKEIFKKLFPKEMSYFVIGFSVGYHQTLEKLCRQNGLAFLINPPVEELLKNWRYFFTHKDFANYRIDGEYIKETHYVDPVWPSRTYTQETRDLYSYKYEILQKRPGNAFNYLEIPVKMDI